MGDSFEISSKSKVNSETEKYAKKYAQRVITDCKKGGKIVSVNLYLSVPEDMRQQIGSAFAENDECYAVQIKGDEINLYALTDNGLTYAVSTLLQLIESGNVREMLLFDYPDNRVLLYKGLPLEI